MVRGSPSLKGPTGRELDSCLPRSPRIRGVDGGTEVDIKSALTKYFESTSVKNDKQVSMFECINYQERENAMVKCF